MIRLIDEIKKSLPPSGRIVDIGAGDGRHSKMFHEMGYQVTAIDKKPRPADLAEEIEWIELDVNEPLPELTQGVFAAVWCRNLIQFLPREQFTEKMLPWAKALLMNGGVLAVETFWNNMDMPAGYTGPDVIRKPHPSYYTVDQLKELIPEMKVVWTDQFRHEAPDMEGVLKTFATAQILAIK